MNARHHPAPSSAPRLRRYGWLPGGVGLALAMWLLNDPLGADGVLALALAGVALGAAVWGLFLPRPTTAPGERQGWLDLAAALALVLAVPVVVWWLVGDLSFDGAEEVDHLVRPLPLTGQQETAAGVTALVLGLAAVAVLVRPGSVLRWRAARLPLATLLAAGVLAGFGWRVVTYGGVGVNIGGALYLWFVAPLVAALVGWGLGRAYRLTRWSAAAG